MIDEATLSEQLHALEVTVPLDLVQCAVRTGRRRSRLRRGGSALGVAGVVAVIAVAIPLAQRSSAPQHVFTAGIAPATTGPTTCAAGHLPTSAHVKDDAGLERVCLPHPAPGFPYLRTGNPTTTQAYGGADHGELVRTFLVAASPHQVSTINGAVEDTSTGPEATVQVARQGSFPTTPAAVARAHIDTVIGTTTIRSVTATVARPDGPEIEVLVQLGGFDIRAYTSSPDGAAPTVKQLTTLIDSLRNLG